MIKADLMPRLRAVTPYFWVLVLSMGVLNTSAWAAGASSQRALQAEQERLALQSWYQNSAQQQYQPLNNRALVPFITLLQQSFATTADNPMAFQPSLSHDQLAQQWAQSGWQWHYRQGQTFVRLQPSAPSMSGQGAFVLRQQSPKQTLGRGQVPLLIQAPHRFYDTHTGQIALLLSTEAPVQAIAWNTVPRYENKAPDQLSDLAHQPNSIFALFAVQFALQNPAGRVIQLHGFAREKRTTAAAQRSQLIVSSGTATASDNARKIAGCLAQSLSGVSLYGQEVHELGGTQNSTGQQLRQLAFSGFIHLEMSLSVRQQLLEDTALRQQFAQCLSA